MQGRNSGTKYEVHLNLAEMLESNERSQELAGRSRSWNRSSEIVVHLQSSTDEVVDGPFGAEPGAVVLATKRGGSGLPAVQI